MWPERSKLPGMVRCSTLQYVGRYLLYLKVGEAISLAHTGCPVAEEMATAQRGHLLQRNRVMPKKKVINLLHT